MIYNEVNLVNHNSGWRGLKTGAEEKAIPGTGSYRNLF